MAFQSATGWTNLPNGVFSPVIYSKKVQTTFRKKAVAMDVTNTDYFGEIANFGDSVKIIKEPEITIVDYARGTKLVPQDLEDSDFTLTVDRAKAWAFKVDDIETSQSHVNWEAMARDRAAYQLADAFDQDILGYMSGYEKNAAGTWVARTTAVGTKAVSTADSDELLADNKLTKDEFSTVGTGTFSIPMGVSGTYDATPLEVLARMSRLLDENNVPSEDRFIVVDPVFLELLLHENSKFINGDYNPGADVLPNGLVTSSKVRGFSLYKSNNLPYLGTGPGTFTTSGSATNLGVLVAGHKSAVATAEQMAKTQTHDLIDSFGKMVKGMHLYGRKILRPEALVRALYNASK